MNKTLTAPATATDVRAWFAENPEKVPAEAAHTVGTAAKGRIHPAARAVFNAESGMTYTEGTKAHEPLTFHKIDTRGRKQPRKVMLPKSQIRALCGKGSVRGPLSAADMAKASEVYTKQVNGL